MGPLGSRPILADRFPLNAVVYTGSMASPTTNDEWTLHSLNIHGIFFERWCRKVIDDSGYWRLIAANEPVEYPPPRDSVRGKESSLDLHAARSNDEYEAVLLVECKKNNPKLTDWIFFSKPDLNRPPSGSVPLVTTQGA
jgi:hypothetical protein